MKREITRREYQNGGWGGQSVGLIYDDGLTQDGFRYSRPLWIVAAWDRWAHETLAAAKAHYRRIGA